jgi:hypothetical protein
VGGIVFFVDLWLFPQFGFVIFINKKIMNEKILRIPYEAVKNDWDFLQKFLELKGNPRYIIVGDVYLYDRQDISDLGNLVGVEGDLNLRYSSIESLGDLQFVDGELGLTKCKNIKTLGKLKKVVGNLVLNHSSIQSLGKLEYVGGDLMIQYFYIFPSEINNVNVGGRIYR